VPVARLIPAKCPNCGASLRVDPDRELATCTYCQTSSFVQTDKRRATAEVRQRHPTVIELGPADRRPATLVVPIAAGMILVGLAALFGVQRITAHMPGSGPATTSPVPTVPHVPPTQATVEVPATDGSGQHGAEAPEASSGDVGFGPVRVSGGLPAEVVQRIIRNSQAGLRACYRRALSQAPKLECKINVKFVIGRDGNTTDVDVTDSAISNANLTDGVRLTECIRQRISASTFPQPAGGPVTVAYPLILRTAETSKSR
jgi:hypothetical protein